MGFNSAFKGLIFFSAHVFRQMAFMSFSLLKIKIKPMNNTKRRYSQKCLKTKLNAIKYVSVMLLSIARMKCGKRKVEGCFYPMLLDFQKNTACCRLPGFVHVSFW